LHLAPLTPAFEGLILALMGNRPSSRRTLISVFAAVACSFVLATAAAEYNDFQIQRAASEIIRNSSPSVDYISRIRTRVRELEVLLDDGIDELADLPEPSAPGISAPTRDRALDVQQQIEGLWSKYRTLPTFPTEPDLWPKVDRELRALDTSVQNIVTFNGQSRGERMAARAAFDGPTKQNVDRLDDALLAILQLNAQHQEELGRRMERMSRRSIYTAVALDGVSLVLTVVLALLLLSTVRHYQQLERDRADELEEFAGRVAHDIRGPISAVALSVSSIERKFGAPAHELASRAERSLARANTMIDALLDFARAGARPLPGAGTESVDAVAALVEELQPLASAAKVELSVEGLASRRVACSPGVLMSLLGNLARNAIKYMGERPVRRVVVRMRDVGTHIRFEVADTGPGLPPGFEHVAFQPYVRGQAGDPRPGIGLGLATVKRLAEAHGGAVGVESTPGAGSVFWFELPRAEPPPEPSAWHAADSTA
jgi:signal transduction histidine kinase